jgi:hypothetical protein
MGLSDSCPDDGLSNDDRLEAGAAEALGASLLELGVGLYVQA